MAEIIFGEWQPTGELRWLKLYDQNGQALVLQQKRWCWEAKPGPLSTILPVRTEAWHDVETVTHEESEPFKANVNLRVVK